MLHFDDLAQSVHVWGEASDPPSHPGQPTLSRTDCRLDAMPLLSHECWAGGCPPTVRLRPRRDQWLWPGDGRGLGTNTDRHHSTVCFFFMWLTQWTHLAQPPDDTPTLWQCQCVFYDIMVSGTTTFKVCKKKSIIYPKKLLWQNESGATNSMCSIQELKLCGL